MRSRWRAAFLLPGVLALRLVAVPAASAQATREEPQTPVEAPDDAPDNGMLPDSEVPGRDLPDHDLTDGEQPDGDLPDTNLPDRELPSGEDR
jgi:hypothetical protein